VACWPTTGTHSRIFCRLQWYADIPADDSAESGLNLLKDVAHRLALTFGMDNKKFRRPMVDMFT